MLLENQIQILALKTTKAIHSIDNVTKAFSIRMIGLKALACIKFVRIECHSFERVVYAVVE